MNRRLLYIIIVVVALTCLGIVFFYDFARKTTATNDLIEQIKEENKAGFDSLQNAINRENNLDYRIKQSINKGHYTTAYSLIDSLPTFGKTHSEHIYRGMIFEAQENYSGAVEEYNKAISLLEGSIGFEKRANVYVKMNKLDLALSEYKKLYEWNYDYSFQIGNIFEQKNNKDSALNYYHIYLGHYPQDTIVQERIERIKQN